MLYFILGVCAGAYFADAVRETVPFLDPKEGATNEVT